MKATSRAEPDAIVIGAGFGGLGAALGLAERGRRVLLLEALGYPGGCASTFSRGGVRFEAGATLFSGLGEGGLFRRWIDTHALEVEVEWLDPVLEFRSPTLSIDVTADRERLVDELCALPGAPARELPFGMGHQPALFSTTGTGAGTGPTQGSRAWSTAFRDGGDF